MIHPRGANLIHPYLKTCRANFWTSRDARSWTESVLIVPEEGSWGTAQFPKHGKKGGRS